jgi:hypothetical protein
MIVFATSPDETGRCSREAPMLEGLIRASMSKIWRTTAGEGRKSGRAQNLHPTETKMEFGTFTVSSQRRELGVESKSQQKNLRIQMILERNTTNPSKREDAFFGFLWG